MFFHKIPALIPAESSVLCRDILLPIAYLWVNLKQIRFFINPIDKQIRFAYNMNE